MILGVTIWETSAKDENYRCCCSTLLCFVTYNAVCICIVLSRKPIQVGRGSRKGYVENWGNGKPAMEEDNKA